MICMRCADLELERVLVIACIDGKAGLWIEILRSRVRGPNNLRFVQELVDLKDRPLLVWPVWPHGRHQSRSRLSLKLNNNAADIVRFRHPQNDLAAEDVEVRVVGITVMLIKVKLDNHCDCCRLHDVLKAGLRAGLFTRWCDDDAGACSGQATHIKSFILRRILQNGR